MAADTGHYESGKMDIREQQRTWAGFTGLVKWTTVSIVLLMILLAFFRTHSG